MNRDKAYKVYSYDCFQMYTDDDCFACEASFDTLAEAVAYCKTAIDKEIADDIKRAEAGQLTTPEQIKEARSQLSNFGWNYFVRNDEDPAAKGAFQFLDYAEQRLMEIIMQRQART